MKSILKSDLPFLIKELEGESAQDVLAWADKTFGGKLVFASSLGQEDQVILDMIYRSKLDIAAFTLDTGRLFNESYDLIAKSEKLYSKKIGVFFPNSESVEKMVKENGVNLFFDSSEKRKMCCHIRKLAPLKRALKNKNAWICGLRKDQSVTRENVAVIEWDENFGVPKLNPLIDWNYEDVKNYLKKYNVPYNTLHDKGFVSIGCACCTRAIEEGEDIRAGRWWWEAPEQKECGLHIVDGKVVRTKTIK